MGQSQSLPLESNENLENDEIIDLQNKRDVISINIPHISIIENSQTTLPAALPATLSPKTEGENIENKISTTTLPSYVNEAEEKKSDTTHEISQISISEYAVNYEHVNMIITGFADSTKTSENHSGFKLLDIIEKMNIETNDCSMWQVGTKQNAKRRMKSVIEFAENNASCSKDVKVKLRIITKLIMDSASKNDYKYILLLIASHGDVCNVMKEVAINNAYGTMTNNLREYIKSQSLQQQILKVLYDFRVLLVEKLFHAFKFHNNTHYIAGFHNQMAKEIGVKPYNDPNICYPSSSKHPNWKKNLDKRYFKTMYTKENILQCIITQIDEKKIGYQKVVKFFQDNCPRQMRKNKFLEMVIDIDNGKINENYLCWLLHKLDIFVIKDDEWKEIEVCWDETLNVTPTVICTEKKRIKKKRKRRNFKKKKRKA